MPRVRNRKDRRALIRESLETDGDIDFATPIEFQTKFHWICINVLSSFIKKIGPVRHVMDNDNVQQTFVV
jgi:hypothetical protein